MEVIIPTLIASTAYPSLAFLQLAVHKQQSSAMMVKTNLHLVQLIGDDLSEVVSRLFHPENCERGDYRFGRRLRQCDVIPGNRQMRLNHICEEHREAFSTRIRENENRGKIVRSCRKKMIRLS